MRNTFFVIICGVLFVSHIFAQTMDWKGQISGWTVYSDAADPKITLGARILPGVFVEFPGQISLEASLNAYEVGGFRSNQSDFDGRIKPYRLWARFATSQFEARVGLQKINFGSASIFRPLMWFDRIDPRDPLQITDGVYALLCRYYFLNNTNIWLWGIYGEEALKGWETLPTRKESIEYGSRFQLPLFAGELGLTVHRRQAEFNLPGMPPLIPAKSETIPENRFALDGKWDVLIGFWIEGAFIHQKSEFLPNPWQRYLNLGADYTFGLGNGLNVLAEYFEMESSAEFFGSGMSARFLAFSLNYPWGLLDQFQTIFYFDCENENIYRFASWRRVYDNWTLFLIGFWNPTGYQIYQAQQGNSSYGGTGFQFMLAYNF